MDSIIKKIKFEIGQIDRLIDSYAGLLEKTKLQAPDMVEIAAIGSVLHSFYNGLENIFLLIAKHIDKNVPSGSQWHRELLKQMTEPTSDREAVLTDSLSDEINNYMGFRHFYRHSYTFFLEWDKLENLVIPLAEVWKEAKTEIERVCGAI